MDPIAQSLQKAIKDNFSKLNLIGLASVPEVMCSCTLLQNGATVPSAVNASTPSSSPTPPSLITDKVTSQFAPGKANDGTLHPADPGNASFILPQGVTPEDIIMEQATGIATLQAEAEQKAAAAAKTTVVTKTTPGGGATISISVPVPAESSTNLAATPTIITQSPSSLSIPSIGNPLIPPLVEKYAHFRYDLDDDVKSYRDTLTKTSINRSCHQNYLQGARDMMGLSLSSWCIYIIIIAMIYYFLFT